MRLLCRVVGRLIECPPLPRRLTLAAWEKLWLDGIFRGFVLASIAWLALIAFALLRRTRR
jgi:hypothetical protein